MNYYTLAELDWLYSHLEDWIDIFQNIEPSKTEPEIHLNRIEVPVRQNDYG